MIGAMEPEQFEGTIGRYHWESEPHWPDPTRPPTGAPNVLVVLLDDVGFAQLGCFGSDIDTPTFDRLAADGIRYTNFHTTALCSPTRACVLTGRNHHSAGMGRIIELATGFPGYDARIPRSCALLPEMLVPHGYAAWAVGKWHLTPEEETHLGARRDRWPLGRGFERFYGFFPGETHQTAPALVHDNHFVEAPAPAADGYHLTEDLANRTLEFLDDLRHVDGDKPWLCYLTPGACHSPHQAPPSFIEAYRGRFDDGWDAWRERTLARQRALGVVPDHTELSPRPDWVPAWEALSTDERRLYARYMEAFAGFLTHTDAQIGRVVDRLDELGELDRTLVVLMSDNGASSEGGPTGSLNDVRAWNALPRTVEEAVDRIDEIGGPTIHNNYPWGWTVAGNTPFRRWKRETHEGGVADPCIVHWPAGIPPEQAGTNRSQYVHAIDIVPTVLELIGVDAPDVVNGVRQRPIEGSSFAATLTDPGAAEHHPVQHYEMFGCRALYQEGWKAVTYHDIQFEDPGLDRAPWELYDLRADPSECHDLAAEHPDRLASMVERWWAEAERHQVLPVDNRPYSDLVNDRPTGIPERSAVTFWPGRAPVPERQAPRTQHRPHRITAHVVVGGQGGSGLSGALAVQGNVLGGWSLHCDAGRLLYVHNLSGWRDYRIAASLADVGRGPHTLGFTFEPAPERGGTARLLVDGVEVAVGQFGGFAWNRYSLTGAGLTVGHVWGLPPVRGVTDWQAVGGTLERVEIEVGGTAHLDPDAEAADVIAQQ
jgi:arylsulfatase